VDNKPPNFDLSCGGTFTVVDQGDESNLIADFSGGGFADIVQFQAPDNTLPGCDEFDFFTIDAFALTGSGATGTFANIPADGRIISFRVGEGNLDSPNHSFPLQVTDASGNISVFSTGTFAVDNDVLDRAETNFSITIQTFSTPDQELFPGDTFLTDIVSVESDLVAATAVVPDQTNLVDLTQTGNRWRGQLRVEAGDLFRAFRSITFTVTDDAGNTMTVLSSNQVHITNDTRIQRGGGGGAANLHRGRGNTGYQTQDKRAAVRDQIEKTIRSDIDYTALYPSLEESLIKLEKPYFSFFRQGLLKSREKVEKTTQPKVLENRLRARVFGMVTDPDWEKSRDNVGGFHLQNTLKNLKNRRVQREPKVLGTLRKTELANRGKRANVRYKKGLSVQR
jgi:hypothetical protein